MILNMKLEGLPEEIVNEIVSKGIASNKSEAIRLVILHYNEHFGIKQLNQYIEDQAVVKKIQFLEKRRFVILIIPLSRQGWRCLIP